MYVTTDVTGDPGIQVELTDRGQADFAELTKRLADQQMPKDMLAIVIAGEVQSAPLVQAPVTDGRFQISGFASAKAAQDTLNAVTTG